MRSGIFFKALANFQWDRLLTTDIISQAYLDGCYEVGHVYPDLCARSSCCVEAMAHSVASSASLSSGGRILGKEMTKLAVMQPYFLPYVGYWQLMAAAGTFVLYDNIQYTKKGWINRNRFLLNGRDAIFTIPVQNDSDYLDVAQRKVADAFNRGRLLNQLAASYRKAPFFEPGFFLISSIVNAEYQNLFEYIRHSIQLTADYLGITTPIVTSSTIGIDHSLRGESKVIAICANLGAGTYINAIGGQELYSKSRFEAQGITLKFLKTRPIAYRQFGDPFVPNLSVIDLMMFNPRDRYN